MPRRKLLLSRTRSNSTRTQVTHTRIITHTFNTDDHWIHKDTPYVKNNIFMIENKNHHVVRRRVFFLCGEFSKFPRLIDWSRIFAVELNIFNETFFAKRFYRRSSFFKQSFECWYLLENFTITEILFCFNNILLRLLVYLRVFYYSVEKIRIFSPFFKSSICTRIG